MGDRTGARHPAPGACAQGIPPLHFSLFALVFFIVAGCAAPGEPHPKRPPVPEAISNLAVRQVGDAVVLTFTLPKNTVEHEPLTELPAVEIYRGWMSAGAGHNSLATRLVYTIPGAQVDTYLAEGRVTFLDPLRPEEVAPMQHRGQQLAYMVRTRASQRRASADSNTAALRVYPVPERITDVRVTVTEKAIDLSWSAPSRTTGGAALGSFAGYRVFRGEVQPGAESAAAQDLSKAPLKSPLELLGPAPATSFRDTQFEFGRTYVFTVRSVAQYASDFVESADSPPLVVTPKDIFPPAAPEGLVAAVVPAAPDAPAHIELSWGISPEPDWAGYHVYRSEEPAGAVQRMTRELLLSPIFRDLSAQPGKRYTYRVSAVDRSGNESPLSTVASAEVLLRAP